MRYTFIILAATAALLWQVNVHASPGDDGCVGNCPGGTSAPTEVSVNTEVSTVLQGPPVSVSSSNRTDIDQPVASAASVIAGECSSGGGIQLKALGLSKASSSTFCQRMVLAEVYFNLGLLESALEQVELAAKEVRADTHWRNLRRVLTAGILD